MNIYAGLFSNKFYLILVFGVLTACGGGGSGSSDGSGTTVLQPKWTDSVAIGGNYLESSVFEAVKSVSDYSDNITTLWVEKDLSSGQAANVNLWSNRFDSATGIWGVPVQLDSGDGWVAEFELIVDSEGDVTVVWTSTANTSFERRIVTRRYSALNAVWESTLMLENSLNSFPHGSIRLVKDASNDITAVYSRSADDIVAIRYDASNDKWLAVEVVIPGNDGGGSTDYAFRPYVVIDESGIITVVAGRQDNNCSPQESCSKTIYSNRYNSKTGWSTAAKIPTTISPTTLHKLLVQGMVVDRDGKITLIFENTVSSRQHLYATRFVSGGGWTGLTNIDAVLNDGSSTISTNSHTLLDTNGNVSVVWLSNSGGQIDVASSRFGAMASTWGAVEIIELFNNNASNLDAVIADNGKVTAVWQNGSGSIMANSFSPSALSWRGTVEIVDSSNQRPLTFTGPLVIDGNGTVTAFYQDLAILGGGLFGYGILSSQLSLSGITWVEKYSPVFAPSLNSITPLENAIVDGSNNVMVFYSSYSEGSLNAMRYGIPLD